MGGGGGLRGDQTVNMMWMLKQSKLKIDTSENVKKDMKMIVLLMRSDVI